MTGDPNEAISFQYRIAELYEKHLDDVPRAVELYREHPAAAARSRADAARARGPQGRRQGSARRRRRPRAGLRGDERLAEAHQRPRGAGPARRPIRSRRSSSCTASRASTRTRSTTTRRRSTRTRARSRSTTATRRRSAEPRAARDGRQPLAARGARSTTRSSTSSRENAERFVELGLRIAQIFEVQLEDVDSAIARYRRVARRSTPRTRAAIRVARSPLRPDRALGGARGDPRARGRDRPDRPTRSSSSSTASGRCTRRGSTTSTRRSRRTATSSARRPSTRPTLEALEALFARGRRSRSRSARSSSRSTARSGEWEKLAQRPRGAARAHARAQEERLAAYYRLAELLEEKLLDAADDARRLHPRAQGVSRSTRRRARRRRASRRSSTAAGRRSRTRTPTSSALHADPAVQRVDRQAPRADVRGRARRHQQGRGDVQVRPRRRRRSTPRRSRTSIASTCRSSRGPSSRRSSRCASRRPTDSLELVELYARLGETLRDAARRRRRTRSAPTAASSTSSTRRTRARSPRSRASTSSRARGSELDAVYERELENASGDVGRGRDPREDRAPRRRQARPARARHRDVEASSSICAARTRRRSHALANLYESRQAVGRARRHPRARVRHRAERRRPRRTSSRAARASSATSSAATTRRSRTGTASSTSTTRTSPRSARSPTSAGASRTRTSSSRRSTRSSTAPRRCSTARSSRRSSASSARPTASSSQQPFDAADAWRKLLEVGPDFEAMDALEAIYRGEEKWTDVIDVKMQRAEALEEPAREDRGATAASPPSGASRSASPTAHARPTRRSSRSTPTHDEAFARAREAPHRGRALGAARRALSRAPRDARGDEREDRAPPQDRARLRGAARRQEPGARRARQRARRGLPRPRDRALPRADGAGDRPLGRGHPDASNGWLKQQTEPQQKIRLCLHLAKWYGDDLGHPEYAQPYYAQIIQLDPNNVGALRQMAQPLSRRARNWQQMGATLTRALDVAVDGPRSQGDPERPR